MNHPSTARSVCWCLISDVNSLGGDGLCLKSYVNLDFVRVTNTLFIRQLLWLMYGLLWHEAEINKTTTTSDGKTGANFLAPGKWCSPKLSWACAETSIRRDVMLTVMWVSSKLQFSGQPTNKLNTMTGTFWSKEIITSCTMIILTRNKKIVHKFLSFCPTYFESLLDCSRLPQICYIFIMCN